MRGFPYSAVLFSLLTACGGAPNTWDDAPDDEVRASLLHPASSARAVRNPGFAFIDVDGDERYLAGTDQIARLDASGALVTPYSLVVPHDRRGPLLWDYGALSLDVGGDLILKGKLGCYAPCSGTSCPTTYRPDCSVDIQVGGDLDTTNRAEIVSYATSGSADIQLRVDGDMDLRGARLVSTQQASSGADDEIRIVAGGSVDAFSLDVDMEGLGHRSLEIAAEGSVLNLSAARVAADAVGLETCWSTAEGCTAAPMVDARRFRVDVATASLCLDGGELDDAVDTVLRTNRRTASNPCH